MPEDRGLESLPRVLAAARLAAIVGAVCLLVSVLVYEKPGSFYTNFVIFPTVLFLTIGSAFELLAVILALLGLRGSRKRFALWVLVAAVAAPALAMATIQLIQRWSPS